jgi:flagellar biosynthetic protein FliQ
MVARVMIDALWVALCVAGPILGLTTGVGLGVSMVQALTQVNEGSIAFVAKLVTTITVILVAGSWMLVTLVTFLTRMLEIPIR